MKRCVDLLSPWRKPFEIGLPLCDAGGGAVSRTVASAIPPSLDASSISWKSTLIAASWSPMPSINCRHPPSECGRSFSSVRRVVNSCATDRVAVRSEPRSNAATNSATASSMPHIAVVDHRFGVDEPIETSFERQQVAGEVPAIDRRDIRRRQRHERPRVGTSYRNVRDIAVSSPGCRRSVRAGR